MAKINGYLFSITFEELLEYAVVGCSTVADRANQIKKEAIIKDDTAKVRASDSIIRDANEAYRTVVSNLQILRDIRDEIEAMDTPEDDD